MSFKSAFFKVIGYTPPAPKPSAPAQSVTPAPIAPAAPAPVATPQSVAKALAAAQAPAPAPQPQQPQADTTMGTPITLDSTQLAVIIAQAVKQGIAAAAPAPAPADPPAAPAPKVVPKIGDQAIRIDDQAAVDADHVQLPVTGHILSLPQPDKESFASYYLRVAPQARPDIPHDDAVQLAVNIQGALLFGMWKYPSTYTPTGDPKKDWPVAADSTANPRPYETPAEAAADDAAKAQWSQAQQAQQTSGRQLSVHYPEFDQFKGTMTAYIQGLNSGDKAAQASQLTQAQKAASAMGVSLAWAVNYFSADGGGY